MYSIAKGQFSLPRLWKADMASIEGESLIAHKEIIYELHRKLKTKIKTTA